MHHRQDGFNGHAAIEPETGLFTAGKLTMAAGEDNHEAVVGLSLLDDEPDAPAELEVLGDCTYSFAALCGVSPIEASSGKTQRLRPNRGGQRQANAALYRAVLTRLRLDPATRDYLRRTTEGLSKREVIRCLKRYRAATPSSPGR